MWDCHLHQSFFATNIYIISKLKNDFSGGPKCKSTITCDIGTTQCDDEIVKCKKKNKETTKCDKSTLKCDVGTAKYDNQM